MKYKLLSWEEGQTESDQDCIMAKVLCTPSWFSRVILQREPYYVNCYGERNTFGWTWYSADSGQQLETTSYSNFDCWGAHRYIGDFLNNHREELTKKEKCCEVLEKIQKARKV